MKKKIRVQNDGDPMDIEVARVAPDLFRVTFGRSFTLVVDQDGMRNLQNLIYETRCLLPFEGRKRKRRKPKVDKECLTEEIAGALYSACCNSKYIKDVSLVAEEFGLDLDHADIEEVFKRAKQFVREGSILQTPRQYAPHLARFILKAAGV